jgi:hypothetical protein
MSNEYQDDIGILSNLAKGGIKLGQWTGLLGQGWEYGGAAAAEAGALTGGSLAEGMSAGAEGASASSTSIPYGGMAAAAAWLANNIFTGNDYPSGTNYPAKQAMMGAGALLSMTPAWPLGIALGLGSLFVNAGEPDKPKILLSGSENVKWGDEGLGGFEGILYPEYSQYGSQGMNEGNYVKGEDYIKSQIEKNRSADITAGKPTKTYEEMLDEYNNWDPSKHQTYENSRGDDKYDWNGIGAIDPESWVNVKMADANDPEGVFNANQKRYSELANPIQSEKYGTIKSAPDIYSQGGMWLQPSAGGNDEWQTQNYGQIKDTVNNLANQGIEIFNSNVMNYLNTLPESEKATILDRLSKQDFNIDYKDLQSGEFTGDNSQEAMQYFLKHVSESISDQLISQAEKAGIPKSAFTGEASSDMNTPQQAATANSTEGSTSNSIAGGNDMATQTDTTGIDLETLLKGTGLDPAMLQQVMGTLEQVPATVSNQDASRQQQEALYQKLINDYASVQGQGQQRYNDLMANNPDIPVTFGGQDVGLNMGSKMGSKNNAYQGILSALSGRSGAVNNLGNYVNQYDQRDWQAGQNALQNQFTAEESARARVLQKYGIDVGADTATADRELKKYGLDLQAEIDREKNSILQELYSNQGNNLASYIAAGGSALSGIGKGVSTGKTLWDMLSSSSTTDPTQAISYDGNIDTSWMNDLDWSFLNDYDFGDLSF